MPGVKIRPWGSGIFRSHFACHSCFISLALCGSGFLNNLTADLQTNPHSRWSTSVLHSFSFTQLSDHLANIYPATALGQALQYVLVTQWWTQTHSWHQGTSSAVQKNKSIIWCQRGQLPWRGGTCRTTWWVAGTEVRAGQDQVREARELLRRKGK